MQSSQSGRPSHLAGAADDPPGLGEGRGAGLDCEEHDEVRTGAISVHECRTDGAAAHGTADDAHGVLCLLEGHLGVR